MTTATATYPNETLPGVLTLTQPAVDTLMRVSLACSADPVRFQLVGVSISPVRANAGGAAIESEICATDGKILCVARIPTEGKLDGQVIISDAALKMIRSQYSKHGETLRFKKSGALVRVSVDASYTTVAIDGNETRVRHIEGTFPDYEPAINELSGKPGRIADGCSLDWRMVRRANGILGIGKDDLPLGSEDFANYREDAKSAGPLFHFRSGVLCAIMPLVATDKSLDRRAASIKAAEEFRLARQ